MRIYPFRVQTLRLPAIVIVALVAFMSYVISPAALKQQLVQAQQSAQNRYGSAILLCQPSAKMPTAHPDALPTPLKMAAVNDDQTLSSAYDPLLPAQLHAVSINDLTAILCVHIYETVYATDTYTNGKECRRYRENVTIDMLNVKLARVIRTGQFNGPIPPECPPNAPFITDTQSEFPDVAQVITWATQS